MPIALSLSPSNYKEWIAAQTFSPSCDVFVIGGGIGGLTCAAYLAQAGMKVVLAEKHYKLGGCCSSFYRGEYYFDAGAHYLSSCRLEGQLGKIKVDLGLKIDFLKCDPSDILFINGQKIRLKTSSVMDLCEEFAQKFPQESQNLLNFWRYIHETSTPQMFADLHSGTFSELLDGYFKDKKLKQVLSLPLGNLGLPSHRVSALTAAVLFKEYILDGGYYPKGGMQRLPDSLAERYLASGGHLLLLTKTERIHLDMGGNIVGVSGKIAGKESFFIRTKNVVATCDPFELESLLDGYNIERLVSSRVKYEPSVSCFAVHLGIDGDLLPITEEYCNICFYEGPDINLYYQNICDGKLDFNKETFFICSIPSFHDKELLSPHKHSVHVMTGVPMLDKQFWDRNSDRIAADLIEKLERFFPGVSQRIVVKQVATPFTFLKYTNNYKGAMYGWASTVGKIGRDRFQETLGIRGLSLVGHWAGVPTGYSGVATVAASGRFMARIILREHVGKVVHSSGVLVKK